MDCIFCKIINGDIPAKQLHSDEHVIAIADIKPQAPQHILIIPRKHIPTINELTVDDSLLAGHMLLVAQKIAKSLAVAEAGYRLVFNCNEQGGQEVMHIHLHLLAGRRLHWPPG